MIALIALGHSPRPDHEEVYDSLLPGVPRKLVGDPLRLRQILVNLISNALKFTDSGEICLTVENQSITGDRVKLLFSIQDTGIGIDPKIQDTLFNAFAQADGSMTRKYGGTGLGLAICKKIIHQMGGRIWLESQPGTGSTFSFTVSFPYLPGEDVCNCIAPPALKDLKVLIVEDNATSARIMQRFIESFGFRAEMAQSAEEALTLYEDGIDKSSFDLVLMDILLPDMDGISAAEKIQKSYPVKAPPIIIVSAHGRGETLRRARDAGPHRTRTDAGIHRNPAGPQGPRCRPPGPTDTGIHGNPGFGAGASMPSVPADQKDGQIRPPAGGPCAGRG